MLKLDNIVKVYQTGSEDVTALRGVSLSFRESEFVAVLGHSGCGKTTLLNIIGGLDHYTSGDLVINGRSTRDYRDSDWDTYRNHTVGFVFQTYNLIPHQTVLANVELALTLTGVGKAERRRRAAEALEKVGLRGQMKKRPNQLSGGQMQRVAIARALVNDPDILLADEPTGALDSETSVQVMDLLQEVAHDRLVIMVTHNPELAERYATRIIRLKDGAVTDDSNPFDAGGAAPALTGKQARAGKKPSMSFPTAFSLSMNNLRTKKGRTVLTAFAGSIGIIGIALILSLSTGINAYINQVQEETLSSYPITIQAESTDMSSLMTSMMGSRAEDGGEPREADRVYSSNVMIDMLDSMVNAETTTNDLKSFKEYLDQGGGGITDMATVHYSYDFDFNIYTQDEDGNVFKSDVISLMQDAMGTMFGGDYSAYFDTMGAMYERMDVWEELLPGGDGELIAGQVYDQYDLLYGKWPERYDQVILFVNERNEISDLMLYAMGFISQDEIDRLLDNFVSGEEMSTPERSWSYDELCGMTFKLVLPAEYYQRDAETGGWVDLSATQAGIDYLYNSSDVGTTLEIVGVARPSEDATTGMVSGAIGYTGALTQYAIETTEAMEVVREQMDDPATDVFSTLPFPTGDEVEPSDDEKRAAITEHLATLPVQDRADAYVDIMSVPSDEYVRGVVEQQTRDMTRESIEDQIVAQYAGEMGVDGDTIRSYIADMSDEELFARVEEAVAQQVREQYAQGVAARMGSMSAEQLAGMLESSMAGEADPMAAQMGIIPFEVWQYNYLYDNYMPPTLSGSTYADNMKKLGYVDKTSPTTVSIYAATFAEKDEIAARIAAYNDTVEEEQQITYTDYVALLMSSITGIISGISYLLIAFVSISLIVSSIMIAIITYISVQERTKEIGILRAVGASKRDVSRVFNAETLIEGLCAGLMGILITVILIVPINALLLHLTGIQGLRAVLPVPAAAVLVLISILLTVIAGLIPSRMASKKDPVVALRTE